MCTRGLVVSRLLVVLMAAICIGPVGCTISKNIIDVRPPPNMPPLQELEQHLNYHDPDAGRPDYVRVR